MNRINLWFKVRKFQKLRDRIYKRFKKEERELKSKKVDVNEIGGLYSQASYEDMECTDEIQELNTRYLITEAEKLIIPVPSREKNSGFWEESRITGSDHLTTKGIAELRSAIRKESRERKAAILIWVTALIGLVGAVSGLIAVISSL